MRSLELSEVHCEACDGSLRNDEWGRPCAACGGTLFRTELKRASSGFDPWAIVQLVGGSGLGDVQALADLAFGDSGSSGPYYRTEAFLSCTGVTSDDLRLFLAAPLDDRIRTYISWKRRQLEAGLPDGHRICARCQVEFRAYDNEWCRAGFCSKACHRAHVKSAGGSNS
jgi:hypothetical protein